jgi:NitT/TauT family transport system ATP-binding protein
MQRLLLSVWEAQKMTILFVTHDVDEALLIADRIVLLTHRPATVADIISIDKPRSPEAHLARDYQRRRLAILDFLGQRPAATA